MAAGVQKDGVKLVLPTHPVQQGSTRQFYAAVLLEVQHIQDTLSQPTLHTRRTSGADTPRGTNLCNGDKVSLARCSVSACRVRRAARSKLRC